MGRKKRAVAQRWNAINQQRDESNTEQQEEFEKKNKSEVTPEEHEKRLKALKDLGLIK